MKEKRARGSVLRVIYDEIGQRTASISAQRPSWPCHKGCDHCCRSLAEPLRLTWEEWGRIDRALAALPPEESAEVERYLDEFANHDSGRGSARSRICPFLDRDAGSCRVYHERPAACRMYGFYVARDGGRYCDQVSQMLEREGDDGLVWGHHEAVENRLIRHFGEPIPLSAWLKRR